jgi:hypothetical protein
VWLPCKFCVNRNINSVCVKLPGPKATARLPPSRIPPLVDVANAEDALLLEYAYSECSLDVVALTMIYGPTIQFDSVRHAFLALAAANIDNAQFSRKSERHKQLACNALTKNLKTPSTISSGDVFASFCLAILASRTLGEACEPEIFVHLQGGMSMLTYLLEVSKRTCNVDILVLNANQSVFLLTYYPNSCLGSSPQSKLPWGRTTFGQRTQSIFRWGLNAPPRAKFVLDPGSLLSIHQTLYYLILNSFCCIYRAAIQEKNQLRNEIDLASVREMLQLIRNELHDPEFQRALTASELSYQGLPSNAVRKPEDIIRESQSRALQSVHLLAAILGAQSIAHGFNAPQITAMATELIS